MKLSSTMIVIFLCLVSFAHLLRLLFHVEIVANDLEVPQWVSIFGFLFPLILAAWFKLGQKKEVTRGDR